MLSFHLTPFGEYRVGVINTCINIVMLVVTAYLVARTERARSALQEAQARLTLISRVTSLGELSASLAHEVNQPLAAIATSGHACLRWLDQDPPNLDKARQAAQRILDDARRAGSIVDRIRSLTRGERPDRHAFDLNAAILEIVALSRDKLSRHAITPLFGLGDGLPPALADRVQIQQVLMNLMLNAIEALQGQPLPNRQMHLDSSLEGGMLVFALADNGGGFPGGEDPDRLFEPFHTTKQRGMGLGLAISKTIIEANGGRIRAETNLAGGATFRFTLPVAEEEAR